MPGKIRKKREQHAQVEDPLGRGQALQYGWPTVPASVGVALNDPILVFARKTRNAWVVLLISSPAPRLPRRNCGSSLGGRAWNLERPSEGQWSDKNAQVSSGRNQRDTAVDGGVKWLALHSTKFFGRLPTICGNLFRKLPVTASRPFRCTALIIDRRARKILGTEAGDRGLVLWLEKFCMFPTPVTPI